MSQLSDPPYTQAQMTYDLRRLRLKGLVLRIPHTNTYVPTTDGIRAAVFYTKLDHRLLHPLLRRPPPTRHPRTPPSPQHHRQRRDQVHHQRTTRYRRLKLASTLNAVGTEEP